MKLESTMEEQKNRINVAHNHEVKMMKFKDKQNDIKGILTQSRDGTLQIM